MIRPISLLLAVLLLLPWTFLVVTGQSVARNDLHRSETTAIPLTNQDVLVLAKANLTPKVIIAKIKTSPCAYEVRPPSCRG
ncbi:MAG: hypothetical protein H0U18_02505 [Pyrinomonadaceae bacterium]|nr:hypothetical protein [Pyrinomonadaceae bacterium]